MLPWNLVLIFETVDITGFVSLVKRRDVVHTLTTNKQNSIQGPLARQRAIRRALTKLFYFEYLNFCFVFGNRKEGFAFKILIELIYVTFKENHRLEVRCSRYLHNVFFLIFYIYTLIQPPCRSSLPKIRAALVSV